MLISNAVILGIIQGITEFLPISSSGHLILFPWIMHFHDQGAAFDVATHMGTLVALFIYFRKDVIHLIRTGISFITKRIHVSENEKKLFMLIAIGTIPAALIGYFAESFLEKAFRYSISVAFFLIIMGLYLGYAQKKSKTLEIKTLTIRNAIFIGFYQALALIPGVSRSGATITAGLLCGLSREAAARFSFLLAMPVIFGAGILKIPDIFNNGMQPGMILPFTVGFLVSAVVGYTAIGFLLRYLKNYSLNVFVWYRILLGGVIILLYFNRLQ